MNINARMLKISLMIGATVTVFGNACGTGFDTASKPVSQDPLLSVARSATGTSSSRSTSSSSSSSTSSTSSTSTSSSSSGSSEVPVKQVIRTLKVKSLCTNSNQYALPTVKQAVDLEARVFDQANKQVLCRVAGIKDQIMNRREVTLPDSCKLPNGSYVLRIAAPGAPAGQSFAETLVDPSDALQFTFQNGDTGTSPGIPIKAIDGNVFASNLRADQAVFVYFNNTWTPPAPSVWVDMTNPAAVSAEGVKAQKFVFSGAEPTPPPVATSVPECQRNEDPPPSVPAPGEPGYYGGDGGAGGGDGGDGAAAPVVKGK